MAISPKNLRTRQSDKVTFSPAEAKRRQKLITAIVARYIKTNLAEYEEFKKQLAARAAYVRTRWGELDPKAVDYLERMALSLPDRLMDALDLLDPRIFTDTSDEKEEEWFIKTFPVFTFKHYTTLTL